MTHGSKITAGLISAGLGLWLGHAAVVVPADAGGEPTPCGGSMGPDVIVSEMFGPISYASIDGIEVFSIGTIACNVGTEELQWVSNTDQHPVIGQGLFRLKDGRLEQVGQSWLKHAFAAAQLEECGCICQPAAGFTKLGVGCSDPYSAGFNGNQAGLGPKSDVNAFTGEFQFPLDPPEGPNDSIDKRLQVAIADLDPAQLGGGEYFIEAVYVSPDDALAGNGHNNASYRPVLVSGADQAWTITTTGSTQPQQAGIRAWQDQMPAVVETDVEIPAEGLLILAGLATDLGDGFWHYEYAVQNINSDRSVGEFSIPISPLASVSNIGFHDVNYHSGEPYDGTDWTGVFEGGAITWQTDSFDINPDANALRWGTMYNFRFDADVPPIEAVVTLGIFKPGSPDSVTASTIGPLIDDCNGNGKPDQCDLDMQCNGTGSADCDENGVPDECQPDADGDDAIDACDGCPLDPLKLEPGACGCGVADIDTDGDLTLDCFDGCPLDPDKIEPGICGCGVPDTDTDGDTVPDCEDECPKSPDIDTDGDETPDCVDGCPEDPLKIDPGQCGCGVEDLDTDGDETADCIDLCPEDPDKVEPGVCGCGIADLDTDGDLTLDCEDGCPLDPKKTEPGVCGCGVPDIDSDGDLTLDCDDGCPFDPSRTKPGVCGCGIAEVDADRDGEVDCVDNCPAHANPDQADCDDDGIGDVCAIASGASLDINQNGLPDECELIGDLNGDQVVNGADLGILPLQWGPCRGKKICAPDFNLDRQVNGADLGVLLLNWTQ